MSRTRRALRHAAIAVAAVVGVRCERAVPAAPPREAPRSEAGPGPSVGTTLPAFELPDQTGRMRRLDDLRGSNGLLLNFNRSVVW